MTLITKCDTVSGNGKAAGTRPHHSWWSQLPQPVRSPRGHEMKALGIAAAAGIALAPFSVVATTPGVAQAGPGGRAVGGPPSRPDRHSISGRRPKLTPDAVVR